MGHIGGIARGVAGLQLVPGIAGADCNLRDYLGRNALMHAMTRMYNEGGKPNIQLVEELLKFGLDIEVSIQVPYKGLG